MSTEQGARLGRGSCWLLGGLLFVALALRLLGFADPEPPAPHPTAGQALAEIATAAADLDLRPLWDNLPPTWQAEAELAVDKLRASANPELWSQGFQLIVRTADLLARPAEEARGVDGSERLAALLGAGATPRAARAITVREARLRLAAGLRTIADSGLDDPENLAYLDLRKLCHDFLGSVEEELRTIEGQEAATLWTAEHTDELRAFAAEAATAGPDQTHFTVERRASPGDVHWMSTLDFIQVEGCWVEAGLAARFPGGLAALHHELDLWTAAPGTPDAEHAQGMLGATAAGLGTLESAASDPEAFDTALEALLAELWTRVVRRKIGSLFD